MNATMETILHRRSIRSFLDKPIPKPVLEEIVLAGQYAPSAMNRQTWHLPCCKIRKRFNLWPKPLPKSWIWGKNIASTVPLP